jgi:hypothetical protein
VLYQCMCCGARHTSTLDGMNKWLLAVSAALCSGCDPAAVALLRADSPAADGAKTFAVGEFKRLRFEEQAGRSGHPGCSYLSRVVTEANYPKATWTTYADVCVSEGKLTVRLLDYPRFTLSAETTKVRDTLAKDLGQRFSNIKIAVE